MRRSNQRPCVHCGERFIPEARNAHHQRYCGAAPCRAASKKASQAKWLAKPENRDYHRGAEAVARVQAWRREHPGYSKGRTTSPRQDDLSVAAAAAPTLAQVIAPVQRSCNAPEEVPAAPLQDLLYSQPIVLVGLIAHLFGTALQDDIALTLTRLIQLGQDIRGDVHEREQAAAQFAAPTPGA